MAVASFLLPQYVLEDGRWAYWAVDLNNNLVYWPNNANGAVASITATTVMTAATHNITAGNDAYATTTPSYNLLMIEVSMPYGTDALDVKWFFPPQTIVMFPDMVYKALLTASSSYVVS